MPTFRCLCFISKVISPNLGQVWQSCTITYVQWWSSGWDNQPKWDNPNNCLYSALKYCFITVLFSNFLVGMFSSTGKTTHIRSATLKQIRSTGHVMIEKKECKNVRNC